jgi:hypothetical protein
VGLPQLDGDRISLLMFDNLQTFAPNMPAASGDPRLNLVLIPNFDAHVGVVRFDTQFRLAGKIVSFRPIVGVGKSREGEYGDDQRQAGFAHGDGSPGPGHTIGEVRSR